MATIAAIRQHSGKQFSFPRITRPSASAGTTVFLAYIFAGLTIQVGVLAQLGISGPEASSWFFITWMTTGLFSLGLSLFTKQPVSINLSIAALVFIAGSAGGFSLAQILGANLLVGVVAVALSLLRLTDTFARIVPPQIAIGVFAGTIMAFMWKTSILAIEDPVYSAPAIGGVPSCPGHHSQSSGGRHRRIRFSRSGGHRRDAGRRGVNGSPPIGPAGLRLRPFIHVGVGFAASDTYGRDRQRSSPGGPSFRGVPGARKFLRIRSRRSQLGQRTRGRSPCGNRRGLHRNLIRAFRRPQGVAFLGHRAIVRSHNCGRAGRRSGDSIGAGPSSVLHPHRRGIGTHGVFQSVVEKNRRRSDAVWSDDGVRCRRVAPAPGRTADGFLGTFGRGCGGRSVGI